MSVTTKPALGALRRRDARCGRVRRCSRSRRSSGSRRGPGPGLAADDPRDRGGAAAWIYVLFTRLPRAAARTHRVRMDVFFVGLLVLASVLMLRQPLFFIFMISGFFYASVLRPLPLAVVGVARHVDPRQHAHRRAAADDRGVDLLPRDHQSSRRVVIGAGARRRRADHRAERGAPRRRSRGSRRRSIENAGLHAQLLTQAREAGVLDERQRMAREIHDTIAQGLTGIVTQLEAADQARDRPADRDRHLDNAERLARESLTEARRSVEASMPARARGRDAARRPRRRRPRVVRAQRRSRSRSTITGEVDRAPPRDRGRAPADRPGGAGQRRQARRRRAAPG